MDPESQQLAFNPASWSKVSKKSIHPMRPMYWFLLIVCIIGMLLIFSTHHHAKASHRVTLENNSDYQNELKTNLAHLQELANQASKAKLTTYPTTNTERPISKAYLARQNAPTSMYSALGEKLDFSQPQNDHTQTNLFTEQSANTQFANSDNTITTVEAKKIIHPEATIAAGEFLHATLETAINSDLPGMVRAVVSTPVYSYTGEHNIIAAGSRLIGQYSANIVQGQNRVMIIWNRVLLPNGIAVQLNSPGIDALGRSGQAADQVNTHFLARFGQSALLSIIGAGVAIDGVNSDDQYNSAAGYRMAIAQSFQQSAQRSLQSNLSIKPTIYINQGAAINVFVAHDLRFYKVLNSQKKAAVAHVGHYYK